MAGITNNSFEYVACHEAGHAVARVVLNGVRLRRIDLHSQSADFRPKRWKCRSCCVGFLQPRKAGEVTFNFGVHCEACREFVTSLVASNCAGCAATAQLMPQVHDPHDCESDALAAAAFRQPYKQHPDVWMEIYNSALRRASTLISEQRSALLAVQEAVLHAGGQLGGFRVEWIIARRLSGYSLRRRLSIFARILLRA